MDDNTNLYNLLTTCSSAACTGTNYFIPTSYTPIWAYDASNVTVTTSNIPFLNKENSSDELKINIKKHQIKFNFNL